MEDNPKEKLQAIVSPETNDYLKQILDEIKGLTENVRHLNNRIDSLESKTFVQKASEEELRELLTPRTRTAANDNTELSTLKKSSFKEKFLKNEKTPNYDSLLVKQENITTFVGKPAANKESKDTSQQLKASEDQADNGKHAYVSPGLRPENGNRDKNSSLLRKIGEFFK